MRLPLLDVLAPTGCAGCGAGGPAGTPLCSACLPAFTVAAWRVPARPPPAYAAAVYRGPVRTAIVAYKERGRREHAPLLAALLARAVSAFHASGHAGDLVPSPGERGPVPPVVLVPVPTRRAAALRRGDHPVARLAGLAAQATGATVLDVLRYARPVADQAALGAADRAANLAGAFHVPPRRRAALHAALAAPRAPAAPAAPGAPAARGAPAVIVVDDVRTTGATLAEAVRALGEAGCRVSGVAVAAATVLRVASRWPGGAGMAGVTETGGDQDQRRSPPGLP